MGATGLSRTTAMPRIACPDCSQQLNVPDGARAIRCPACKSRIDLPLAPPPPPPPPARRPAAAPPPPARRPEPVLEVADEPEPPRRPRPVEDDEPDDRPRRRRGQRRDRDDDGGPIRGLIAFVLFGPACVGFAFWAPFSGVGTALAMLGGAFTMLVGIIGIVRAYFRDPVLTERIGDPDGYEAHVRMMVDCIPAAFAHPRHIAAWTSLGAVGSFALVVAICAQQFLKTMADEPNRPPPGPVAPATPPPKPLSDDEVVAKALADLDAKQPGTTWGALDALQKIRPTARREEVVRKVAPLIDPQYDGPTRTGAVKVVGAWGSGDDALVLIKQLDGKDVGVREESMRQLIRFRDPRAIPALLPHINDYDAARAALVAIGPAAEPHLIPFLAPRTEFQKMGPALKVLKEIGTAASVPHITPLAASEDEVVSRPAREALAAITARTEAPRP